MTLSYQWRLVSLSAAVFFLVNLVAGTVVAALSPLAVGWAGRLSPRQAARFSLALRLFPGALAAVVVALVCVPSYVWLEPGSGLEYAGGGCLAAAAMGVALGVSSIVRLCRAATRTRRVVRSNPPCLALAGMVRPRLLVSNAVLRVLTHEQLAVALAHERAHWTSRDNWKRLLILAAPGVLPFCNGLARLERAWARFAEWAADDAAVAGDECCSLSLAAALVRVARLQSRVPGTPLAIPLLGELPDLRVRVQRLLEPALRIPIAPRRPGVLCSGLCACVGAAMVAVLLNPTTLETTHSILERLME
jgi:Zn-dependent protease with chaperone function